MSSEELQDPILREAVVELLDTAVDERSFQFHELFNVPIELDNDTGEPAVECLDRADNALLELVFISDARAQARNDEYTLVNEISWVDVARQSIKRMSHYVGSMTGLDEIRLLSDAGIAMQKEAYDDMRSRRSVARGDALRNCTGLEYATRVAMGEIVLETQLAKNKPKNKKH